MNIPATRGRLLRRGLLVAAALVALTSSIAVATLPDGLESTSIAVQDATNSNNTVYVEYYDAQGNLITEATEVYPLQPNGGVLIPQAANENLPPGANSQGQIGADGPVSALLIREFTANRASNAHSYSAVTFPSQASPQIALPILLNNYGPLKWNSRFIVTNQGGETACLRIRYFISASLGPSAVGDTVVDSPTGQTGCPSGYRLPVGGSLMFGSSPNANFAYPALADQTQSAALIEVLNPTGLNDITAYADIYRSDGNRLLGSYDGFAVRPSAPTTDDAGTEVIMPLAIKSQSGYYTVIGVQNLGTAPADVSIRYLGTGSNGQAVDTTVTLPAVANVGFHSSFDTTTPLPVGFVGYAIVTSSQPVAALLVRAKQTSYLSGVNEPIYTAVNGVPRDRGATGWNMPLIYRRVDQLSSQHIGWNSWIQVQVADGSTAQVTLRLTGTPGTGCGQGPYQTTATVSGSKVFYMNADADNGFPAGQSPSCFRGTAQVSANKPVIVIAQISSDNYPGGDNEALYNAVRANVVISAATPTPSQAAATATRTNTATPTVNAQCPAPNANALITGLDKAGEIVTIAGSGNLTGWYLISVTGNQRFDFPQGFILNGSVQIVSGTPQFSNTPTRLWWSTNNFWNNSDDDDAILYNCLGQQRSYWDD